MIVLRLASAGLSIKTVELELALKNALRLRAGLLPEEGPLTNPRQGLSGSCFLGGSLLFFSSVLSCNENGEIPSG